MTDRGAGPATARALIGEGGPLRLLEARCHLTRPRSQIAVALAATWLPIVALGIATELATGHRVWLLHDAAMHVRFLVATPLLLFLDRVFPRACTQVIDQLHRNGFIPEAESPRFVRLLVRTRRLSELWLPEIALAIGALVLGASTLVTNMPVGGMRVTAGHTPSDWWYALVGLPLFEFLVFRSLWRWLIWVRFVFGLSRIDLDLDPTHPDRRGGISILRKPSLAYCAMLLFALSAVLSAAWGDRFEFVSWTSFVPILLVIAVIAILVAFAPLLAFALQLHRARVAAVDALGGLAARNGRWFRDRWISSDAGEVIGSGEIQSLAAIGATYRETVKQMRVVLFDKKDLISVLLATLLPVVPSMLAQIPYDEWLAMASFVFRRSLPL